MRDINEVVIHCTATRPDWWKTRSSNQKVAEVKRWHVEERGWSDIGYHFLIDRNGTVVSGRPIERTGAHVKGRNKGTVGIALFGGYGGAATDLFEDHFTPEQKASLLSLIREIDPDGRMRVTGHNEHANKGCPCFQVVDPRIGERIPRTPEFDVIHPDPAEQPINWIVRVISAIVGVLSKGKSK